MRVMFIPILRDMCLRWRTKFEMDYASDGWLQLLPLSPEVVKPTEVSEGRHEKMLR